MFAVRRIAELPPYGPPALSFPEPDGFREGFVVEFTTSRGETWIGNFATFDERGLSSVHSDLGSSALIIVAGSVGYIVDAENRRLVREMGFGITDIWFEPDLPAMIVTNGLWFEAFTSDRILWRSRRVSWDGMRNLKRGGLVITGEAYNPTTEEGGWLPFRVSLATGDVEGGSYSGPAM